MTLTFQVFRNKKHLTKYLIDEKLKTSGFFIFEIKRAKMDKIFILLKGCLSVISIPMDMIFDVFSGLFKMALIKSLAFIVFEILRNLVSMQNFLNANNCWCRQNFENFPKWPYLYFWCAFRIIVWYCLIFRFLGSRKC